MHIACEKGHLECLRKIIEIKGNIEAHVIPQEDPRTPLHLAAEYAHEECVTLLLGARADCDAQLLPSFLLQFKNYAQLAKSLKRLVPRRRPRRPLQGRGWRDCVTVLDDAVAACRRTPKLGAPKSSSAAAAASAERIVEIGADGDGDGDDDGEGGGAENGGDDANGAKATPTSKAKAKAKAKGTSGLSSEHEKSRKEDQKEYYAGRLGIVGGGIAGKQTDEAEKNRTVLKNLAEAAAALPPSCPTRGRVRRCTQITRRRRGGGEEGGREEPGGERRRAGGGTGGGAGGGGGGTSGGGGGALSIAEALKRVSEVTSASSVHFNGAARCRHTRLSKRGASTTSRPQSAPRTDGPSTGWLR